MYLQLSHIVTISIVLLSTVYGLTYPECIGVPEGTYVTSKSSCAKYIFCDGANSFEGTCLDDNYFNVQISSCDDREAVKCHLDEDTPIIVNSHNQQGFFNGIATNFMTSNSNSGAFGYSNVAPNHDILHNMGQMSSWSINNNHKVNSNSQQLLTGNLLNALGLQLKPKPSVYDYNPPNNVKSKFTPQCPLNFGSYDALLLPSMESCSTFYACFNGIAIPMACAQNAYFNAQSGKCEQKEHVSCLLDKSMSELNCEKGVYDFIPHRHNCQYYYFCANGNMMIFQCPINYTWHFERRTCVHHSQSKCYAAGMTAKSLKIA